MSWVNFSFQTHQNLKNKPFFLGTMTIKNFNGFSQVLSALDRKNADSKASQQSTQM